MVKRLLLIAAIVSLLDQLTKFIFRNYFYFTKNYGAAFGLFQGHRLVFILTAILVIIFVLRFSSKLNNAALGFLLGGTIGNLIDRLFYGYVIDFINLGFWPSFNLADSFSTIGVLMLIYLHWNQNW